MLAHELYALEVTKHGQHRHQLLDCDEPIHNIRNMVFCGREWQVLIFLMWSRELILKIRAEICKNTSTKLLDNATYALAAAVG